MRKIILLGLIINSITVLSQEKEVNNYEYNKWSIELNTGVNKPIKPFSDGYYSSGSRKYFNLSSMSHFDLGTRYMFSDVFGVKMDFGYDKIESQEGSGSLEFKATKYSVNLQGVANLGNIMNFKSFTNRFSILGHGGVQISQYTPEEGRFSGKTEDNGAIILGISPQIRISKRIVLTGDFSSMYNVRQHYNWDGKQLTAGSDNLTGVIYTTSLGLTFYLGRNDQHADWYNKYKNGGNYSSNTDMEARKKIAELEKMLNDEDKDGVADYLDLQNNTPTGVAVDTRGRFIDVNRNSIPDELEKSNTDNLNKNLLNKDLQNSAESDALRSLIKDDHFNIFFDVNQDYPNNESTESIFKLIKFLKLNPETKIKLLGYADIRGGEKTNIDLSRRRAQNIYKILVSSGINQNKIIISAEGVDKTFNAKNDKINLNLARRVTVELE